MSPHNIVRHEVLLWYLVLVRFDEILWDLERFCEIVRFCEIQWDMVRSGTILWYNMVRFCKIRWDLMHFGEIQWDSLTRVKGSPQALALWKFLNQSLLVTISHDRTYPTPQMPRHRRLKETRRQRLHRFKCTRLPEELDSVILGKQCVR